jgi:hypothetical protein
MLVFLAKSLGGGFVYEEVKVLRGTDRLRLAYGGDGHAGSRGLPETRDSKPNLLQLQLVGDWINQTAQ